MPTQATKVRSSWSRPVPVNVPAGESRVVDVSGTVTARGASLKTLTKVLIARAADGTLTVSAQNAVVSGQT
jgi:hypothetical protein